MAYKRGGGFQDPNATRVLTIQEEFYGLRQWTGAGSPPNQVIYGGAHPVAGSLTIFGNLTVTGFTAPNTAGRQILQGASGAAVITRVNSAGDAAAVPITQLFNTADSLSSRILMNRRFRRYTLTVPVRRTVAGTARLEFGLVTSANMVTFAGTPPGVIWSSDPAVNGGRFLPRYRQVGGAGVSDGNDSGFTPDAWHTLGIRYTEGAAPTLEWMIDENILRTVSGDANMPTFPGGINWPGFVPGYGISTPAGSTWQFAGGRFHVEEV